MSPEPTTALWEFLASGLSTRAPYFDPTTIRDLPEPAARWLRRAVPGGTELRTTVELAMSGRIRLGGRWLPFAAAQILQAGVGFVWRPLVGHGVLRFSGSDSLGPDPLGPDPLGPDPLGPDPLGPDPFGPARARTDFRLHGLIPVASASGPDIARSAAGRLAAETVAWLPPATTPQCGATWRPAGPDSAVVSLPTPAGPIEVHVEVDSGGRLRALRLDRWDPSQRPPAPRAFGGFPTSEAETADGVRIASSGVVGWDLGTAGWERGRFFEFDLALPGRT